MRNLLRGKFWLVWWLIQIVVQVAVGWGNFHWPSKLAAILATGVFALIMHRRQQQRDIERDLEILARSGTRRTAPAAGPVWVPKLMTPELARHIHSELQKQAKFPVRTKFVSKP